MSKSTPTTHRNGTILPDAATLEEERFPFWARNLKGPRNTTLKSLLIFFGVVTIVLYAALSIFWGSNWLLIDKFSNINILVVDFDSSTDNLLFPLASGQNSLAGPPLVQELNTITSQPGTHLTYQFKDASLFPGGEQEIIDLVGYNAYWGAVVVHQNATSLWRTAIQTGNSTYDPTGSVSLYFSAARFYQVVLLYVVPFLVENVSSGLSKASQIATQNFINDSITSQNATAFTTANLAPQTLGSVFSFHRNDIRPITHWASAAWFEAALIYFTIFVFHTTLYGNIARMMTGLNSKLKLKQLILLRLIMCYFLYFWISLAFTTVMRAFQLPMYNHLGNSGFVVLWAFNFVGMIGVGLALEFGLSLLTPKWFPMFLITWIIINITSSFLPQVLQQRFYTWFVAFPFFNLVQTYKLVLYGTQRNHLLGLYFGILVSWAIVGTILVILTQILDRKRNDKIAKLAIEEKKKKESEIGQIEKNGKVERNENHHEIGDDDHDDDGNGETVRNSSEERDRVINSDQNTNYSNYSNSEFARTPGTESNLNFRTPMEEFPRSEKEIK